MDSLSDKEREIRGKEPDFGEGYLRGYVKIQRSCVDVLGTKIQKDPEPRKQRTRYKKESSGEMLNITSVQQATRLFVATCHTHQIVGW